MEREENKDLNEVWREEYRKEQKRLYEIKEENDCLEKL